MKTKILTTFSFLVLILVLNQQTNAQTLPFINTLSCKVVVGFELRDPTCLVCDFGTITLNANSTTTYNYSPTCGPTFDACFWVISINGAAVATNHISHLSCCNVPVLLNGPDPSGCSSSGNYQVINNYPTSFSITP